MKLGFNTVIGVYEDKGHLILTPKYQDSLVMKIPLFGNPLIDECS